MIEFKLEKFAGPLGLLLELIEKEELDITQIGLAKIADQYIEYIKAAKNIDPDELADFLVVAARLLYIKSKALLPYLYSKEEEEEIRDLEEQLRMYREFVEASKKISSLLSKKKFLFVKEYKPGSRRRSVYPFESFSPPKNVDQNLLQQVFIELLENLRLEEQEMREETLERKINIEEKIFHIQNLLEEKVSFSFNSVLKEAKSKTEVIVSFLAVLELAKQRELFFEQGELFSEIIIKKEIKSE